MVNSGLHVTLSSQPLTDLPAELLVIGVRHGTRADEVAQLDARLRGMPSAELRRQGFKGAAGSVVLLQTHGALPAQHVLLVGLGEGLGPQCWYTLAHAAVTRARELKYASVAVAAPRRAQSTATAELIAEGVHLSAYTFDRLKSAAARRRARIRRIVIALPAGDAAARAAVARATTVATATCYARDLVNLPAAIVTPTYLAEEARRIARRQRLRARVLDARALKSAGMGALLGVAQGSAQPPRFIELVYQPRRRTRRAASAPANPQRVALAGKGITFDSGGLSIKSADAMQSQKRDMAGGAAVLGVMSVVRDLEIPVEVRAYIPATENMPGSRALKPGDVVRAYNGKTIEVLNTDAEGRLVLADALSYAAAAQPDVLIDLATLTAAVRTALGSRYAAIMGSDATLVQALITAGQACGENLWELPLVPEYRSDIDSAVADLKNIGEGPAGTIIGGLFLKEFVGTIPWAHIDFSSTVVTEKTLPGHPKGATGFGVRTLLRYLSHLPSVG